MAKKTQSSVSSIKPAKEPNDSSEKLQSIRHLLFGDEVTRLESLLEQQRNHFDNQLAKLEKMINISSEQLDSRITQMVSEVKSNLQGFHTEHEQHEEELEQKLGEVGKRLDDFKTHTQSDLMETHRELDKATKKLYQSLDMEVKKLRLEIDNTSKELSNNKADRKTLASLLESMATNLNQGQA